MWRRNCSENFVYFHKAIYKPYLQRQASAHSHSVQNNYTSQTAALGANLRYPNPNPNLNINVQRLNKQLKQLRISTPR